MGNVQTVFGVQVTKHKKADQSTRYYHKWDVQHILGKGSFGVVRYCVRKPNTGTVSVPEGTEAACKVISKQNLSENELRNLNRESTILNLADHPHCVRLFEIYDAPHKLFLIMELCRGGELFDAITESGCFTEAKAMSVIRQVASALDYLHSNNVAHRDLKPENILYYDEERTIVKLMDFGLAKVLDENDVTIMTRCGTLHYVAPEVLSKQGSYSYEVDMWSLGVVLYVLLCGYLPFYHDDRHLTAKLVRLGRYEFDPEEWSEISDDAKDLINKLICLNVGDRLSAKQVLEHPWLANASETANSASRLKHLAKASEHFAQLNAKRHEEKLAIFMSMQRCSIQLKRWMQKAADNVGQMAPADPTPDVDYTE